tara:strand:+ start:1163 stop:2914 length:1752 start_codon:yes stop_codon:yes gene_type:complete
MAEKVTIEVDAEVKKALDNLEKIKQKIDDISDDTKEVGDSAKKAAEGTKTLATGFNAVGVAMKAANFTLVSKMVNKLFEGLQKNQQIADAVSTAFNIIGVVTGKVSEVITTAVNRAGALTGNFDALGRIITNLIKLALNPVKLVFNSLALVIKEVQLSWEQSWLGKGDVARIQELTQQITGYKQEIKDAAEETLKAGKGIVVDFREGIGEVVKLGEVVRTEFNNTFKDLTVKSVLDQAEAVTKATTNIGLLQAKLNEVRIEFETQAEQQRAIRDDISQSIDDRIQANAELLRISQEQADAEIEAIKAQQSALRQRMAVEVDNADLKAQIAELDNAALETELRRTQLAKESKEQENALDQERIANKLELDRITEQELEKQEIELTAERDRLIRLAEVSYTVEEEKNAKILQIKNKFDRDILKAEVAMQSKQEAMRQQELQRERALQENKMAVISGALSGIGALVGKETQAGKMLAVAQATIDTYAGATKALAQGGVLGYVGAAGVIATGIANIKTITQTPIPDQPDGPPPPAPEQIMQNAPEELALPTFGAIEAEAPPVQAYVVESDVSNAQAIADELALQATL